MAGTVSVNGRPATVGMEVRQGDQIVTEENDQSYVDVQFSTGHVVRLKNGKLRLDDTSKRFTLLVEKGKLFSHIGKLPAAHSFKIITPMAVAGVRGTKFMLEASQEETYLCVCEEEVWARRKGASGRLVGRTIYVKAGQDVHIKPTGKMGHPKESPTMVQQTWEEFKDMGFQP